MDIIIMDIRAAHPVIDGALHRLPHSVQHLLEGVWRPPGLAAEPGKEGRPRVKVVALHLERVRSPARMVVALADGHSVAILCQQRCTAEACTPVLRQLLYFAVPCCCTTCPILMTHENVLCPRSLAGGRNDAACLAMRGV